MQRLKDEAIVVLALLVDPEPCDHFDHHGDCQTHGTGATRPCPHARAKALLAELVQRAEEHTEVCR